MMESGITVTPINNPMHLIRPLARTQEPLTTTNHRSAKTISNYSRSRSPFLIRISLQLGSIGGGYKF